MSFSGELIFIHIAKAAGMAMEARVEANLISGSGIAGDRYANGTGYYSDKPDIREVTLIEHETLEAIQRDFGIELLPGEHRRNLTTRNVPLNHLVGRQFRIGDVILEGGRLNTPCKYLETLLRKRVARSLIHRSGLNCRVIKSGTIRVGDVIEPVPGQNR